jgi:hypothetical protein
MQNNFEIEIPKFLILDEDKKHNNLNKCIKGYEWDSDREAALTKLCVPTFWARPVSFKKMF